MIQTAIYLIANAIAPKDSTNDSKDIISATFPNVLSFLFTTTFDAMYVIPKFELSGYLGTILHECRVKLPHHAE